MPLDPEEQDCQKHAVVWVQPDSALVRMDLMMLVVPLRFSFSSLCGFLGPQLPAMDLSHKTSAQ